MTDNQLLFSVVVLLYLSECLFWVNSQGLAFVKTTKEWKVVFPSSLFGNSKGGLALTLPFPPLGKVFLAYFIPVSFSERGIVNATLEGVGKKPPNIHSNIKFVLYEDIKSTAYKGVSLIINGDIFCECGSAGQAIKLREIIQNITGHNKRKKEIHRCLKSLFDVEQLKAHDETFKKLTQTLFWFCNLQFIFLLIIAPILVYFFGTRMLIASGLYVIFTNLVIIIFFYLANRKIYPNQTGERVADILKMFFCPPMTIRASDVLSLRYFTSFHPLAVARLVLNDRNFEHFAKQTLLSFNNTFDMINDSTYKNDLLWHIKAMELNVKHFIAQNGIKISDLETTPEPTDGTLSYCPRCHTQYVIKGGQCSECDGVILVEYKGKNDE